MTSPKSYHGTDLCEDIWKGLSPANGGEPIADTWNIFLQNLQFSCRCYR